MVFYVDAAGRCSGRRTAGDGPQESGWYAAIPGGEIAGPFLTAGEAEYAIRLERQRRAELDAIDDPTPDRDGEW